MGWLGKPGAVVAWLEEGQGGPGSIHHPQLGAQRLACGPQFPKLQHPMKSPVWFPWLHSRIGQSWQELSSSQAPTLYPEALTCSPLLVRVDFMRTKKERSWTWAKGGASAGLASGVREVVICPKEEMPPTFSPRCF